MGKETAQFPVREIHRPASEILAAARRQRSLLLLVTVFGTLLAVAAAINAPRYYAATVQIGVALPSSGSRANDPIDEGLIDSQLAMLKSDSQVRAVADALERSENDAADTSSKPADVAISPTFYDRAADWIANAFASNGGEGEAAPSTFIGRLVRMVLAPLTNATDKPSSEVRSKTFLELKNAVKVYQERRSRVISVRYTHRSPREAARRANLYAKVHIQKLLQRSQSSAQAKLDYLKKSTAEITADVARAEIAVQLYRVEHGLQDSNPIDVRSLSEIKRQLALARTDRAARQAALEKFNREPTRRVIADNTAVTAASLVENQRSLRELESDVQLADEQVQRLEQHLTSLQQVSVDRSQDWVQLRVLERQATSTGRLLEDMLHSQQETTERLHFPQLEAEIVAPAIVPSRPSTPSPLLFVPLAVVCFSLLGMTIAYMRERLGGRLYSEHQAEETLGIACAGSVPRENRRAFGRHDPFSRSGQAFRSLYYALTSPEPDPASDTQVVAVTSSLLDEGADHLAAGLAACAGYLGRRTVLLDLVLPTKAKPAENSAGEQQRPDAAFRHIGGAAIGLDLTQLTSERLQSVLSQLKQEQRLHRHSVAASPHIGRGSYRRLAGRCDVVCRAMGRHARFHRKLCAPAAARSPLWRHRTATDVRAHWQYRAGAQLAYAGTAPLSARGGGRPSLSAVAVRNGASTLHGLSQSSDTVQMFIRT